MKIEEVRKLSPLDRLLYFIQERESIRLKRKRGLEPPWTDDEILQRYRFCNVRRMDDKVSLWLLENWYKPYFDHPNMLAAIALARHINQPSSLEAIGFPSYWDASRMKRILRALKRKGATIFNAAYMVRGNIGKDKLSSVIDYTVQPLVDDPPEIDRNSLERTWEALLPYYGWASFMAGQVVADLRWAIEGKWKDRNKWAPMGPGSKRGLNRLHERPLNEPMNQEQFLGELRALITVCKQRLPKSITKRLEAHDYQNCLCELDKVCRVLSGEGRPKQLYNGAG